MFKEIIRLWRDNWTVADIAKKYRTDNWVVMMILKQEGVYR